MDQVVIGKVVGFHGIKGEIKVQSLFPYKEKAYQIGTHLRIGDHVLEIARYRRHKNFDLLTFVGYSTIDEVDFLVNQIVYKSREELHLEEGEVLDQDLLQYRIKTQTGEEGMITEIFWASKENKIIRVQFEKREVLIPYQKEFIIQIDSKRKEVLVKLIPGM